MLNKGILCMPFLMLVLAVNAQEPAYNPYVSDPSITPAPLPSELSGGAGVFSFTFGNSGTDTLSQFDGQRMVLEIDLRGGVPAGNDQLGSIGGTAAVYFTWEYRDHNYIGTQSAIVLPGASGSIVIQYRVTTNSNQDNPNNGFRARIRPGPYNSDISGDNEISLYTWTQCVNPAPPQPGTPVQPSCTSPTGSVALSGLPETGSWTVAVLPGNRTETGTGTTTEINNLSPGTYNFTVTNSEGCTSDPSSGVGIDAPPDVPAAPVIEETIQPGCTTNTGSIRLSALPSGSWTLTRQPGNVDIQGSGSTYTVTGLAPGTYTFTVTSGNCTSAPSASAVINSVPSTPQPPTIGSVTQPSCATPSGSVVLTGLPSGSWTLTRSPGNVTAEGSGTRYTVTQLAEGTYTFIVANSAGCVSGTSEPVRINQAPEQPAAPVASNIVQPTCDVPTGSVVLSSLPSGSWTLVRSPGGYRIEGTGSTYTNSGLGQGTYTYSVINQAECSSGSSSPVVINPSPAITSPPVQRIDCRLGTGNAIVTVTSPEGTGYEYRIDDGQFQSSPVFSGVKNGNHVITVRNNAGCSITGSAFTVSCGCVNGPVVTLSTRAGSACGLSSVTVSGNTFGGNATSVTISEDGAGTVTPAQSDTSPFSFTYTPAASDIGHTVTITVTTNNPAGEPCNPAAAVFTLSVNPAPSPPVTGTITQPTCNLSTGSVAFSGLPSTNTWIITRNPGAVSTTGSGAIAVLSGIESGSYTFTVASAGCVSQPTSPIVINEQPPIPRTPSGGDIAQPTCTNGTGSVVINGLPSSGSWNLTRFPGTVSQSGSGTSVTVANLTPGTYNFTVTNTAGCTSQPSANIVINPQPPTPQPPVTGNITAPTCPVPTGSVSLSGLPSSGQWTMVSTPTGTRLTGTGSTVQVRGLVPGSYTFTVTNSSGCVSAASETVVIPVVPDAPVLTVNNPKPVCAPATVDITAPEITAGSSPGLTYSYWINQDAKVSFDTPAKAGNGIYYIKAVNAAQCATIKMITVSIPEKPVADAGKDQVLEYHFTANLAAEAPSSGEKGLWSVVTGSGSIQNSSSPVTVVSNLGLGKNVLLWTVSNGVCPASSDTLNIIVHDLVIPTLITPNNDGRNDFLVLRGTEELIDNELIIFDRRGVMVFRDDDYRNNWNGVDLNGKPLADDTYFFVFRAKGVPPRTGYIVVRK